MYGDKHIAPESDIKLIRVNSAVAIYTCWLPDYTCWNSRSFKICITYTLKAFLPVNVVTLATKLKLIVIFGEMLYNPSLL